MGNHPPRVLIATSEDWVGIAKLPRYLSLAGARVAALAPRGAPIASSSFVDDYFPGSADAGAALDLLRGLLESGPRFDWIIFGDDVILERAAARSAEPWLADLLPGKDGSARPLVSKSAFSAAMRGCGVPMPAGRAARGAAMIAEAAADLGLPVVAKPDAGFGGQGIFAIASAEELDRLMKTANGDYLIERRVDGRLGGTAVLFDRGRPAWWSSFLKVGVFPPPFGPSARRLAFEPPNLEPILEKLGSALGLHGLFGVDWIQTPGGDLFVIELNGRPIPMHEGVRQVAEGLPAALRDFLAGVFTVRRPAPEEGSGLWHAMPASLALARAEGDRRLSLRLMLGLGVRTDIPWADPGLVRHRYFKVLRSLF